MIWQLTDDYRIKVVPLNFILEYMADGVNPKTGEPTREPAITKIFRRKRPPNVPDRVAQHPEVKTIGDLKARLDGLAAQLSKRVGK